MFLEKIFTKAQKEEEKPLTEFTTDTLAEKVAQLEEKVQRLELSKKRDELGIDWDTSFVKILMSVFSTYVFSAIFMYIIDIENFLLSALVPAAGYLASLFSVPYVKKLWLKHHFRQLRKDKEIKTEKEQTVNKLINSENLAGNSPSENKGQEYPVE